MVQDDRVSAVGSPPLPSPLPPQPPLLSHTRIQNRRTQVSPFIQNLRSAVDNHRVESGEAVVEVDQINPIGWYFFYGTLVDASFLAELLELEEQPVLRPAKVVGYYLRLWGQYPALVDGEESQEVCGVAWQVKEKKHAIRLQEFETRAYRCAPCTIYFTDTDNKVDGEGGYSFKYCGIETDLRDGRFVLEDWLKSMGRTNQ